MAKLIKTDGTEIEVAPKKPRKGFTCAELYELIGCEIVEPVGPNAKSELMICDEMGKLNGSKVNQKATDWYWKSFGPYDVIVGNVVICDNKQFK